MRAGVVTAVIAFACALAPGYAHAATAPPVQWCGTDQATTDRPDVVTGRQIHVVYAYPSDGVDRFSLFGSAIATDLGAVDHWWRGQDYTRTPRFDLAALACPGTFGSLDISDVKMAHDSSYYYDIATRLGRVRDDLVAAGFNNAYKKYLVYYDTPQPVEWGVCGTGYINPTTGGAAGYAGVWIAANQESTPETRGCGNMEDPQYRGGYTAAVAAHELIHTFGALDTWDNPGPPHMCPSSPGHACDSPLDIMEPAGGTYWIDNMYLDFNHDDYYAHSGTWWDVQDSPWLTHLNETPDTLTITEGVGVASVASDQPGLACSAGAACVTSWQPGSQIRLTATPTAGFSRAVWGGGCADAGATSECDLTLSANTDVTLSYLKPLAIGRFATSLLRRPTRLKATLTLSRVPTAGEASLACSAAAGLRLVTHTISRTAATCVWSVPRRLAGRRVSGRVVVNVDDGSHLSHTFAVRLPKTV
jgi:hypothetical protein